MAVAEAKRGAEVGVMSSPDGGEVATRPCALMDNGLACLCRCSCCEGLCDRKVTHMVPASHNSGSVRCPRYPDPLSRLAVHPKK